MEDLRVNLGERSYFIHIEENFCNLKKIIIDKKPSKVMLITDSNVDNIHSNELICELKCENFIIHKKVIAPGEKNKNINAIVDIYHSLKELKFERKDLILAFGGGVVGDMAGFAASTYLRGISFIQLPTTIIAQCDSSVGGKTGIDFEGGKNLIGAFYQPEL